MGACESTQDNGRRITLSIPPKLICKECNFEYIPKSYSNQTTRTSLDSVQKLQNSGINNEMQKLSKQSSTDSKIVTNESGISPKSQLAKREKDQKNEQIRQLKEKWLEAYEQHYLKIHLSVYDHSQKIYYCKFVQKCCFSHKDYKQVEKHVLEEHMQQLEAKHHQNLVKKIKQGEIGLNKNGRSGFFCIKCQLLYENEQEHNQVCQESENSCFSYAQENIQSVQQIQQKHQKQQKILSNDTNNNDYLDNDSYSFSSANNIQNTNNNNANGNQIILNLQSYK
ncbi:hypothetical protein PPERSA_11494 [Pseudocohnilembus persalinus]|uniref:Uncharacterized protein n=1 Tax=Pseudocohnilembus persalinus TaxID=266149 RepID=A0A0V0QXG9_PSEPJ|nr:hypothetical protein PPERSA_11494 [Pseudocohnilembus persalinus]|eukprot:KRX06849.1 hypothetical protein PPERSA_11494 [Pseudocohnilembus persalinus]